MTVTEDRMDSHEESVITNENEPESLKDMCERFVELNLCYQSRGLPKREIPLSAGHFREEFKRVCGLRTIRKVCLIDPDGETIKTHCLGVVTEPIFCTHPVSGRTHRLGSFLIMYEIETGKPGWANLDYVVEFETIGHDGCAESSGVSYFAPHVSVSANANGAVCTGDATEDFRTFHQRGRASYFLMLAIRFVECVNHAQSPGLDVLKKFPIEGELHAGKRRTSPKLV